MLGRTDGSGATRCQDGVPTSGQSSSVTWPVSRSAGLRRSPRKASRTRSPDPSAATMLALARRVPTSTSRRSVIAVTWSGVWIAPARRLTRSRELARASDPGICWVRRSGAGRIPRMGRSDRSDMSGGQPSDVPDVHGEQFGGRGRTVASHDGRHRGRDRGGWTRGGGPETHASPRPGVTWRVPALAPRNQGLHKERRGWRPRQDSNLRPAA